MKKNIDQIRFSNFSHLRLGAKPLVANSLVFYNHIRTNKKFLEKTNAQTLPHLRKFPLKIHFDGVMVNIVLNTISSNQSRAYQKISNQILKIVWKS